MPFTDKQMFEAIEANADVKLCFERISFACKELKSKTGCPNDDVDRFLEFVVGKWADSSSKICQTCISNASSCKNCYYFSKYKCK